MIWTFTKSGERLSCEIKRDVEAEEFEFLVNAPDGTVNVTRFTDATALIEHSTAYLEQLVRDGWQASTTESPSL